VNLQTASARRRLQPKPCGEFLGVARFCEFIVQVSVYLRSTCGVPSITVHSSGSGLIVCIVIIAHSAALDLVAESTSPLSLCASSKSVPRFSQAGSSRARTHTPTPCARPFRRTERSADERRVGFMVLRTHSLALAVACSLRGPILGTGSLDTDGARRRRGWVVCVSR